MILEGIWPGLFEDRDVEERESGCDVSCKRAFSVCDQDYAMRNPEITGFREYFARDDGTSH